MMSDEAAAPGAEEQSEEVSIEAAADAIRARGEEAAAAEEKAGATSATPSSASKPNGQQPISADVTRARPAPRDIAAFANREWKATQALQQAKALEAKYGPLEQALSKKDLVTALQHMAASHGVRFADFVDAMSQGAPAEKTPAQVAAETVATALKERDERDRTEREAREKADIDSRIAKVAEDAQALADKGDAADADRWELTAVSGKAAEVWDLVQGWWDATATKDSEGRVVKPGEALTMEQALDKIEAKLREKRDARKPKTDGKAVVAAKPRAAATAGKQEGKTAAAPSFSNRNTSSAAASAEDDSDEDLSVPDHEAIRRAAKRAGVSLV